MKQRFIRHAATAWPWALMALLGVLVLVIFRGVATDDNLSLKPTPVTINAISQGFPLQADDPSIEPPTMTLSPDMLLRKAQARRPLARLDAQRLLAASGKQMIMTIMDSQQAIAALGSLSNRQKSDGRSFVAYDIYVLESRGVGDRVEILIPAAGVALGGIIDSVEAVDSVGIGAGEILRWKGTFRDMPGTPNSFSITQVLRDGYSVAVYETPFGTYNMESKNGVGWVVNQTSDFHQPEGGSDEVHQ